MPLGHGPPRGRLMAAEYQHSRNFGMKVRVFISYSRKDMAFADSIDAALKARGFETLIDREEIYAFEDWWKRIEALIGSADTVVFVLSPDAVKSEVALKEVAYAASLNKRFAPIVCHRVEDAAVPAPLRRLNFIFFDDPARFDDRIDRLVDALQTDIGWIRQHTEYGEAERRWAAAGRPRGLLLQSPTLEVAEYWVASHPMGAHEASAEIRAFIAVSRQRARAAQRLRRVVQASIFTLLVGIILGLVAWINQEYIKEEINWVFVMRPYMVANFRPYVLTREAERALRPLQSFRECAKHCPEMIVIPSGTFAMGSPATEKGRRDHEGPQHMVTIAKPFAVARFDVTFDEWDACFMVGGCPNALDAGFGRGTRPVISVNFYEAQQYAGWLSKMTGHDYRLLTEAEWEYAARANTTTAYYWGDEPGHGNANSTDAAASGTTGNRRRSGHSNQMDLGFTTWPETCGNGCRIATMRTTTERRPMARLGLMPIAPAASPVAARGAMFRPDCARQAALATVSRRRSEAGASVSGWQ